MKALAKMKVGRVRFNVELDEEDLEVARSILYTINLKLGGLD
jgi:glutamate formiminotransferase